MFFFCRSLPQQGDALGGGSALAAGHLLQRPQPLLQTPDQRRGSGIRVELPRLGVSPVDRSPPHPHPHNAVQFCRFAEVKRWCSRLARFYADAQELLLDQAELGQLARLWEDASSFSDFMETLRRSPFVTSGRGVVLQTSDCQRG